MISTHSQTSHLRMARARAAHRGFSLIEVAIALVIFVIGALAIIRIFPGALGVIGNNGNQQIATNLNRSVLARLSSEGKVPYANFNVAVNTDNSLQWKTADNTNHTADFVNSGRPTNGDIDASVIGVPRFNNSYPSPGDINTQINNSALSRFRGIQGEQVKITTLSEGTPPNAVDVNYVFTQFPISFSKNDLGANDEILRPTISQEYTVQNARIDKSGDVTFKDATTDDNTGKTVRLDETGASTKNVVPANSMAYVSYRYFGANGQIWSIRDEPLPISANVPSLTDPAFKLTVSPPTTTRGARVLYNTSLPNTTGAVAELIDVRIKRYVSAGDFGSLNDPSFGAPGYPNLNQVGDARRGMVRLDATLIDSSPVFVDYIADWSLLLQQGVPLTASDTTPNAKQLALGAPFVEDQAPVGMYSLLLDKNPNYAAPLPPDFLKPSPFRSQFGADYAAPNAADDKLYAPNEDDLRSGKATFNVTDEVSLARVAYRTRDNWVQQLSLAAQNYKPYALRSLAGASATVTEPWRDYFLGGDNYLYFHPGEAGKTISVSYHTTDDNGPLVDRPFVIEDTIINTPTGSPANVLAAFAPSGRVARVKLTDATGRVLPDNSTLPVSATDPPQLLSIQAVKGVSVTARTAYINGTQYKQKIDTTTRGANQ